jgi:serine/threonine protein kinase
VIHRDIKPSNILIDESGSIKLCDFGISGNLINSNALSRNNTGCAGYMAPERIEINPDSPGYDIRADVWSLGITLVELATGQYPYKSCNSEFEVMSTILQSPSPTLQGKQFSDNFKSFVNLCLIKDVNKRPKYHILLQHPFVLEYKQKDVNVAAWFKRVLNKNNKLLHNNNNNNKNSNKHNIMPSVVLTSEEMSVNETNSLQIPSLVNLNINNNNKDLSREDTLTSNDESSTATTPTASF